MSNPEQMQQIDPAAQDQQQQAAPAEQNQDADQQQQQQQDVPADQKQDQQQEEKPVEYSDFAIPDGMEVNKEMLDAFVPLAKDMKLTQEQAQKLVDLQVARAKQQVEAFEAQKSEWERQSKTDTEIGGVKFDENLALARKMIHQHGSDALRSMLDSSGLGNHPEVIRMLVKIGKQMTEDKPPMTEKNTGESIQTRISNLYSNSNMK